MSPPDQTGASGHIIAGTRISALARAQTQSVISLLVQAFPSVLFDVRHFSTRGDVELHVPLPAIGGKGLFTERLEQALRDGEIDFAVHSLKDLPVEPASGLTVGAILGRSNAADVLVTSGGSSLASLRPGAVVGTSSTRRQAQLRAVRRDLEVRSIRGNVETRVGKVLSGEFDAVVLAAAGLDRLGMDDLHVIPLSFDIMLPAPGQGALAVQCREKDTRLIDLLAAIDMPDLRRVVEAEREFLKGLGGGCSAPVAAIAIGTEIIHLRGRVLSEDGARRIDVEGEGPDPRLLGRGLAAEALSRGAGELVRQQTGDTAGTAHITEQAPFVLKKGGLKGLRIVVTRPAGQEETLVEELAARGAMPLIVPAIRIAPEADNVPLHAAMAELARFNWIAFASVNGVDRCLAEWAALGVRAAVPESVKVAAVGAATEAYLRDHGIDVHFTPSSFTSLALGRELPVLPGTRVLYVTSREGSNDAERELASRGVVVTRVAAYHTEPVELTSEQKREMSEGVAAVLFTSGSTVRGVAQALARDAVFRERFDAMKPAICCIGPSTAAEARVQGLTVDVEAPEHTAKGLVDAVEDYFGERLHGT